MDRLSQVLVSVALLLLVPCFAAAYSRANRVDDQPLSRVALHRQLTAMSSDVTITVSNATLGVNVRRLSFSSQHLYPIHSELCK